MDPLCPLFRVLGNSLDLEETFSTLETELHLVLAFDAISAHLIVAGRLEPAYYSGCCARDLSAAGEKAFGTVARRRTPALNLSLECIGRRWLAMAVPIARDEAVNIVLAVYRDGGRPFGPEELQLLVSLGPKLASAVANAQAYRRAAELAGIDPATGVINRRALFQFLDAELARSRRYRGRLAVLHCSLEGCGSLARLCAPETVADVRDRIATAIREDGREYDFCGFSGDDVVLVLAGFERCEFAEKRSRIEGVVERIGLEAGLPLSIRVGAAFFPEDGTDAEDLLAAAAQASHVLPA